MREKVVTAITTNMVQVDETMPVWCVEYQQGTVSSYRYISAVDEVAAYKKFMELEQTNER